MLNVSNDDIPVVISFIDDIPVVISFIDDIPVVISFIDDINKNDELLNENENRYFLIMI